MTKSRLAAVAVAMIFTAPAMAVTLNPRGIGQVLLYPYYTVNKQQDTLITVVNTGDAGKMMNVRFAEGYNGRPVLAFNVFLSPHDVWTAAVTRDIAGNGALLKTTDRSCVDVEIPAEGLAFGTSGFDGTGAFPADAGPHDATRTREGSIEIVAVGDIVSGSATDRAVTHDQTGIPCDGTPADCAALATIAVAADLVAPTAALIGTGSIVNVGEGMFFGYNADAIAGFSDRVLADEAYDATRASLLDLANTDAAAPAVRAHVAPMDHSPFDVDFTVGIDAVSAVLMMSSITNEYLLDDSIGAATDWIVNFPTRRFYVDKQLYPSGATAPFFEPFDADGSSVLVSVIPTFDREEGSSPPSYCGVPPPSGCLPYPVPLPWQTDVETFGTGTGPPPTASMVLGSVLVVPLPTYGASGWFEMSFGSMLNSGVAAGDGSAVSLVGLPVTGFMVYNVINTNAQPGRLANYSGLFAHRGSLDCMSGVCPGVSP